MSCSFLLRCVIIKPQNKRGQKMKYFIVTAKCGHVGRFHCIWIDFAVAADSAKEAAKKARGFKRVKHNHKDVIRLVREVTFEEFIQQRTINDDDPYLHCKNIQQQRLIENLDVRVCEDVWNMARRNNKKQKAKNNYKIIKSEIAVREAYIRIAEYMEDAA